MCSNIEFPLLAAAKQNQESRNWQSRPNRRINLWQLSHKINDYDLSFVPFQFGVKTKYMGIYVKILLFVRDLGVMTQRW